MDSAAQAGILGGVIGANAAFTADAAHRNGTLGIRLDHPPLRRSIPAGVVGGAAMAAGATVAAFVADENDVQVVVRDVGFYTGIFALGGGTAWGVLMGIEGGRAARDAGLGAGSIRQLRVAGAAGGMCFSILIGSTIGAVQSSYELIAGNGH